MVGTREIGGGWLVTCGPPAASTARVALAESSTPARPSGPGERKARASPTWPQGSGANSANGGNGADRGGSGGSKASGVVGSRRAPLCTIFDAPHSQPFLPDYPYAV
jgi:hypothetical protein